MVILLIILLLILASIGIVYLFKIFKWIFRKKIRVKTMLYLSVGVIASISIYRLFFVKMEFIQSNVYPHVNLVKNQIDNKDSLRVIIKEMVIQKMNDQMNGGEEILKTKYKYADWSLPAINASISFHQYYKTLGIIPFGEAGTAHFIDNEEDPGGFSSELLEHYQKYKIAEFSLRYCKNDTINFFGNLTYWKEGEIIKTDTLFNSCNK